jgi:3-oxoacyl-[acyl-carrier protein] reductase
VTEQAFIDKTAIVTGGTAGIGRAIALALAEQGAKVTIFGTNAERGAQVVTEMKALGVEAHFASVDIADTAATAAAIKAVIARDGGVDVLINNAGITRDGLLLRMKEDDWDRLLDVNLKSCYNTSQAVLRTMMKQRSGRIINISSVVGLTGNPGQVNYAASKAGMIGLTKALAKEVASRNICVNCVAPGFIETAMTDALNDEQKAALQKNVPLGRLGQTKDIADAVLFLAGDKSNYITGQVLTVDGGMVM